MNKLINLTIVFTIFIIGCHRDLDGDCYYEQKPKTYYNRRPADKYFSDYKEWETVKTIYADDKILSLQYNLKTEERRVAEYDENAQLVKVIPKFFPDDAANIAYSWISNIEEGATYYYIMFLSTENGQDKIKIRKYGATFNLVSESNTFILQFLDKKKYFEILEKNRLVVTYGFRHLSKYQYFDGKLFILDIITNKITEINHTKFCYNFAYKDGYVYISDEAYRLNRYSVVEDKLVFIDSFYFGPKNMFGVGYRKVKESELYTSRIVGVQGNYAFVISNQKTYSSLCAKVSKEDTSCFIARTNNLQGTLFVLNMERGLEKSSIEKGIRYFFLNSDYNIHKKYPDGLYSIFLSEKYGSGITFSGRGCAPVVIGDKIYFFYSRGFIVFVPAESINEW